MLLYPEGMVKLNQSARRDHEALRRAAQRRPTIVAELEQAFSATGLERDVLAFVEMAGRQRWLAWE